MNVLLVILNIMLLILYCAIALVIIDVIGIIGLFVVEARAKHRIYAGLKRSLMRHAERLYAPRPHEARDDENGARHVA